MQLCLATLFGVGATAAFLGISSDKTGFTYNGKNVLTLLSWRYAALPLELRYSRAT